jgi:16S rRNA (cytosine1402-N4)-methyltransferase
VDLPVELPGSGPKLRLLTRGAELPDTAEVTANPRAASVRLRAVERIDENKRAQVKAIHQPAVRGGRARPGSQPDTEQGEGQ